MVVTDIITIPPHSNGYQYNTVLSFALFVHVFH